MRKFIFTFALALISITLLTSGNPVKIGMYGVAFYNLENLFDTIHDAGKNDWEFLPDGTNKWGKMKYENKLANMSKVLSELCTDKLPRGAAIIGVSEIENIHVLEDLLKQPALKDRGYKIIHHEGPDRRGVDCAFLYNPRFFQLESSKLIPYIYPDNDTTYATRGFLLASGKMAGENIHVIVNHWPSRAAVSFYRELGGTQVKAIKDSIVAADPNAKVIIMGDLNDDPNDKSITEALGAKHKIKDVGDHDLYNPWWDMLYKTGQGTLLYDGKWNLFDQIIFTGNMIGKDRSTLKYYKNEVFLRDYLIQQEGRHKGNPKRTHASGVWLNGYSDHLPAIVYLVKEIK
jgi:hypothetical protein